MKTFSLSIQTFQRSLKHLKISKSMTFWATEKYKLSYKRFKKIYSRVMFSETLAENFAIKNLKPTSNMVYVNETLLIVVDRYISLESPEKEFSMVMFLKTMNKTITIRNLKLTRNSVCQWKVLIIFRYYIWLKRSWKRLFRDFFFENDGWICFHQKITWYLLMKSHKPFERPWKGLCIGNIFGNVGWNQYHIIFKTIITFQLINYSIFISIFSSL